MSPSFRLFVAGATASLAYASPAAAQNSTTDCHQFGNGISCQTTVQPDPNAGAAQLGAGLGAVAAEIAKHRREARERASISHLIDVENGSEFYSGCNDKQSEPIVFGACYGWLKGFLGATTANQGHSFCITPNASLAEIRDIIIGYMARDPRARELPTSLVALFALGQAFPCAAAPQGSSSPKP